MARAKGIELLNFFSELEVLHELEGIIDCVAVDGNRLFVGTSSGRILAYALDPDDDPRGALLKSVEIGRAPSHIAYLRGSDLVAALVDGKLIYFKASNLEKVHGASAPWRADLLVVEQSMRSSRLVLSSQRKCLVFEVAFDGTFDVVWDGQLQESPEQLVLVGDSIFFGSKRKYYRIDLIKGKHSELLVPLGGFDPLCCIAGDSEVVFAAQGSLGCFITSQGQTSQRSPISWPRHPSSICSWGQFLVSSVPSSGIAFHDIAASEQNPFQTLRTDAEQIFGDASGQGPIFILSRGFLRRLIILSGRHRAELMLQRLWITRALQQFDTVPMYLKAGHILMDHLGFGRSVQYLIKGEADPRRFIALFPELCSDAVFLKVPEGTGSFQHTVREGRMKLKLIVSKVKSVEGLEEQLHKTDDELMEEASVSLRNYLIAWKRSPLVNGVDYPLLEAVDTALVCSQALTGDPGLQDTLFPDNHALLDRCEVLLTARGKFRALGLLYLSKHETRKAFRALENVVSGIWKEDGTDGIDEFVQLLCSIEEGPMLWEGVKLMLEKDKSKALKVLVERSNNVALSAEQVVAVLNGHAEVEQKFLEQKVLVDRMKDHFLVDRLGSLYLEQAKRGDDIEEEEARQKLRILLGGVEDFDGTHWLEEFKIREYFDELVLVLKSLKRHKELLEVLVTRLEEDQRAWSYCASAGETFEPNRKPVPLDPGQKAKAGELFALLLGIYLNPEFSQEDKVLMMLEEHADLIRGRDVLLVLSKELKLVALVPALEKLLPALLLRKHSTEMSRALARSHNLQTLVQLLDSRKSAVIVDETTKCKVCRLRIGDKIFKGLPNGEQVHFSCAQNMKVGTRIS